MPTPLVCRFANMRSIRVLYSTSSTASTLTKKRLPRDSRSASPGVPDLGDQGGLIAQQHLVRKVAGHERSHFVEVCALGPVRKYIYLIDSIQAPEINIV